jgi:hypothetical protein
VTTVRIDADVMQWLKAQGKGYQTRMNKILRDAMLNELKIIHKKWELIAPIFNFVYEILC